MKIGKKSLKMSSGEVRHFKSEEARNNFEHVAQAYKHGWRPTKRKFSGMSTHLAERKRIRREVPVKY